MKNIYIQTSLCLLFLLFSCSEDSIEEIHPEVDLKRFQ